LSVGGGTGRWVVMAGAAIDGTGGGCAGVAASEAIWAVGDGDIESSGPAVAVADGVVAFGLFPLTAAAIAVPPQHSSRMAVMIPMISGFLVFLAAVGTV
jgi:hypothetical protein